MRNKVLTQLLPGFIGLVLSGCQPVSPLTEHLHQYQQRLSRILDTPIVVSSPYTEITLTSPASLSFPQTALTANLAEFYQLEDCPVQALIAQRNTTLGKIQLPSQRYLYETELIALLEGCKARQTLPLKAHQWLKKKRRLLPVSWAKVLSTSEEIRTHLNSQSGTITVNSSASQALEAWNTLLKIPNKQHRASNALEPNLAVLKQHPIVSQIWRSQQQLASSLQYTTQWLRQQSLSSQCHKTQAPPQKIRYITNVFRLFFIQKIQPLASRLNGLHYQITPIIDKMNITEEFPEVLAQQIHQHHHQGFIRYQAHIREHVQYWQQLFKDCSISFTSE